jgi:hypothetical protein
VALRADIFFKRGPNSKLAMRSPFAGRFEGQAVSPRGHWNNPAEHSANQSE